MKLKACTVFTLLSAMSAAPATAASKHHVPAFITRQQTPCTSETALSALKDSSLHGNNQLSSRKQFFQEIGLTGGIASAIAVSSSATLGSSPAYAIEDILDTSDGTTTGTVGSMRASPALKNIKRAEKQLSKMEFYAVENNYEEMKLAIRNPPFSEIRKNSFQIIRDFKGEQNQQDQLQAAYDKFIASLEKMDSTASLAMRGRKLENGALLQSYDATVEALSEWIEVASSITQGGAV